MPIHSCTLPSGGSGFKWGGRGHCYPDRKSAEKQAAAAHANGFTGDAEPKHDPANGQFTGSGGESDFEKAKTKLGHSKAHKIFQEGVEGYHRAGIDANHDYKVGSAEEAAFMAGLVDAHNEANEDDKTAKDAAPLMAAGICCMTPTGRVLFVKRSDEGDAEGQWAFPGGKIEDDEEPAEAARRETQEETGHEVRDETDLMLLDRTISDHNVDFSTFLYATPGFTPKLNEEHTDFIWASKNAPPKPLHPGVERVLTQIKEEGISVDLDAPAMDDETKHDPSNGQFTSGSGGHKFTSKDNKFVAVQNAKSKKPLLVRPARQSDSDGKPQYYGYSEKNGKPFGPVRIYSEHQIEDQVKHANDEHLALDKASVRDIDRDGRLHVTHTNISKAVVNPYFGREIPNSVALGLDPDRKYMLYRDPAELKKAVPTFNRLPVLNQHVEVTADSHKPELVVGSTGSEADFEAPYLTNSLVIWAKPSIDGVMSGAQKELSCAYRYTADMTPGQTPEGTSYDGVMRDIIGNHVALVREGRAGPDIVVGDEKPMGKWNKDGKPFKATGWAVDGKPFRKAGWHKAGVAMDAGTEHDKSNGQFTSGSGGGSSGGNFVAHALSRKGTTLHKTEGHASREEAVKAAWVAKPKAHSISTGAHGGGSDIRWHERHHEHGPDHAKHQAYLKRMDALKGAQDAGTEHDKSNGQFTSGSGSGGVVGGAKWSDRDKAASAKTNEIVQKHGWKQKSGSTYEHKDHPGHTVTVSGSGTWQHRKTSPSDKNGDNPTYVNTGHESGSLHSHLTGFHGKELVDPAVKKHVQKELDSRADRGTSKGHGEK